MGPRGPSVDDVKIVRTAVGPDMKIKVAGGIDTYEEAKTFIDAGVARIGTSHAIEIVTQSSAGQ
jgi:deoxyribose-phosphate aldolase